MNTPRGPRSRPAGEAPEGFPSPDPDPLATSADKTASRRGKYRQFSEPQWCLPPCVLPFHHHGECFTGWPQAGEPDDGTTDGTDGTP